MSIITTKKRKIQIKKLLRMHKKPSNWVADKEREKVLAKNKKQWIVSINIPRICVRHYTLQLHSPLENYPVLHGLQQNDIRIPSS